MSDDLLKRLRAANPQLCIEPVGHASFAPYGQKISFDGSDALIAWLDANTPVPEGSAYTASAPDAEQLPVYATLRRRFFGESDIQIGWCNGTNTGLNGLEYHAGVEINIAAADVVLLLARKCEMRGDTLDTAQVRGFLLRRGEAVLLDSATLHLAPCAADPAGFRVAIVLPRGTNTPLLERTPEDGLLWMTNKWLICHRDAAKLVDAGAVVGLTGPYLTLKRGD